MESFSPFEAFAILAFATGTAEVLNARFLKLPSAMGLVILSLLVVGIALLLELLGIHAAEAIELVLPKTSDFKRYLIDSCLAFLLYAAAISVDQNTLRRHFLPILFFATVGVVLSTVFVALSLWGFGKLSGVAFAFSGALVFGAIIAPTDALAVHPLLDRISGKRSWKTIISGESLFNDAMALLLVVVFTKFATTGELAKSSSLMVEFLREAGIAIGVGLGTAVVAAAAGIIGGNRSKLGRMLISMSLATGSYALATRFDASGPIAVVTAGLAIMYALNKSKHIKPIEDSTIFWGFVEQVLAAMFFFLIGLEVLTVKWSWFLVGMAAVGWIVVLAARFITVLIGYGSMAVMIRFGKARDFIFPMTFAGVRGAISIALALSLPVASDFPYRGQIIVMTFGAVVIGLLIQGGALILMAEPLEHAEESTLRLRKPFRNLLSTYFWRHRMKKRLSRHEDKHHD